VKVPAHGEAALVADAQALERELVEKKKKLADFESGMMGKMDARGLDVTRFEIEHLKHEIQDIKGILARKRTKSS
jgi:hypothetical protein